jgi:hypothetical protein
MLELLLADIEELGHEQLLYFTDGRDLPLKLIMRHPGATGLEADRKLALCFDPAELYYFDAQGAAIY